MSESDWVMIRLRDKLAYDLVLCNVADYIEWFFTCVDVDKKPISFVGSLGHGGNNVSLAGSRIVG